MNNLFVIKRSVKIKPDGLYSIKWLCFIISIVISRISYHSLSGDPVFQRIYSFNSKYGDGYGGLSWREICSRNSSKSEIFFSEIELGFEPGKRSALARVSPEFSQPLHTLLTQQVPEMLLTPESLSFGPPLLLGSLLGFLKILKKHTK